MAKGLIKFEDIDESKLSKNVVSFDDINPDDIQIDLKESVASGSMKIEQDERDIQENTRGMQFIPDAPGSDEVEAPSVLTGAMARAADTASFGLTTKAAALVSKGISEDDIKKAVDVSLEDNFMMDAAGTAAGYALNPLGRVARALAPVKYGANGAMKASSLFLQNAAEVLGVEGGASIVNLIETAFTQPGKLGEAFKEETLDQGLNQVGAALGTGAFMLFAAPFKTAAKVLSKSEVVQKYSNRAKSWLSQDVADLLTHSKELADVNPQDLMTRVGSKLDEYKAGLRQVLDDNKEGGQALKAYAETLDKQIDDSVQSMLLHLDEPEVSAKVAIGKLVDSLEVSADAVSQKYGQHLDTLADLTKGKKANGKELIDEIIKVFELEGSISRKGNKLVANGSNTAFKSGVDLINKLSNKADLTHREIGMLKQALRPAFSNSSMSAEVRSQAKNATRIAKSLFTDESLWGAEAAQMSQKLDSEYFAIQDLFKVFKGKGAENTKLGLKALAADGNSALGNLNKTAQQLEKMGIAINKMDASEMYAGVLPPSLKNSLRVALKSTRETIDYQAASDIGKARGIIGKVVKGELKNLNKNQQRVLDALKKYKKEDELIEKVGMRYVGIPAMQKAFYSPLDGTSRKAAVEWSQKYAKDLPGEISRSLDAAAKMHRLAKVTSDTLSPARTRTLLKDMVDAEESYGLKLFSEFTPEVKELFKDGRVIKTLMKENPSLYKTIFTPDKTEPIEWALGAAGVGDIMQGDTSPESVVLASFLALYRIAKNPTSFNMFVERLAKKGFTRAQQQAIVNGARISSVLAEEMMKPEGNEM